MKITILYVSNGSSVIIVVTGAEAFLRATRRRVEARPPVPSVYDCVFVAFVLT
jgi:hypothetical protein